MSIIDNISSAIERMEGVGCGFHNNPGALRTWPGTTSSGGFADFATCDAGRAALAQQVQLNVNRGLTLEEFFAGKPGVYPGYAPSSDNNRPLQYAANVSQWTGIPADVPIQNWMSDFTSVDPETGTPVIESTASVPQEALIVAGVIAAVLAVRFVMD